MVLKYATTAELGNVTNIIRNIPEWQVGESPENEYVCTGDGTEIVAYFDQKNIVADSYKVYYGEDPSTTTELTETTHYVLDKDKGQLTITAAGATLISDNNIYASYSYFENGMSDSYLTKVLERAEAKVDERTNTTFTDGSVENPNYPKITEFQASPGYFRDELIGDLKPLIDVHSTLNGDIDDSVTTIPLKAGTGILFPSAGSVIINREVISYTGVSSDELTGCTRGDMDSEAVAHTDLSEIHTTILFISDTVVGSVRNYVAQEWRTQMYADDKSFFYLYDTPGVSQQDVADRVKMIYLHGYNTIPDDINRLTLIFAKEMLVKDTVGSALIKGRDEFQPSIIDSDRGESQMIIDSYIVLPMGNT